MTRMLDKVLRRSDAVDKESLCVQAGQRVSAVQPATQVKSNPALGMASQINHSLPGRCGEYTRLRLSCRYSRSETLQKTRGGSCW